VKIGWLSVSLWARTGYGRMSKEIVQRLIERYSVICFGHEADPSKGA